ncbi:Subunit B [Dorcoceras hygrometricum]|uniref:Subunit B n=1 Tax=Dorcoceras hygrometricum TaxID=472368 RepID=A0A2Z7BX60_9LAMI|nr:Subunit B [Dorcoceras hygrometricum]
MTRRIRSCQNPSDLLVQIDGTIVFLVVDLIRRSTATYLLKCRFPCETGQSQTPRRQQGGRNSIQLRSGIRNLVNFAQHCDAARAGFQRGRNSIQLRSGIRNLVNFAQHCDAARAGFQRLYRCRNREFKGQLLQTYIPALMAINLVVTRAFNISKSAVTIVDDWLFKCNLMSCVAVLQQFIAVVMPIRSTTRSETPSSGCTRSADEIGTNEYSSKTRPERFPAKLAAAAGGARRRRELERRGRVL